MANFWKNVRELASYHPAVQGIKETKQAVQWMRGETLPPPVAPPPVLPQHVPTEAQVTAMRGVAERDLPPATPARTPLARPTIPMDNPLRGTLTTPRPLTSAEIQQRAREGIAVQRNILGTPVTPPPAPAEATATEFTPLQQNVIQKMDEQRKALFPDRFPPATSPAGTRTNKRKSKGGIGSFGMSRINDDLSN